MDGKSTIVISGYYGFDNIGDEAVLYSIITTLKKQLPGARLIVLSHAPQKTKNIYQVEAVNRWKLGQIAKVIKESDLLISGGGSLLQDVTSNKTVPYYLAIVKLAQWYKKPVVFYSQGIGPVNKKFNQWLIKQVCKKVNHIFVREENSKKTLENMGVKTTVTVAVDPVLGLKPKKEVEAKIIKSFKNNKAVGVYLRPWHNTEVIVDAMIKPLRYIIDEGYDVYLIPMYYKEDLRVAEKIHSKLDEKTILIDRELSIEETIAYTAQFDFIIGMRLHSLIMASSVNVPMLALSYDPKVKDFAKLMGIDYTAEIDTITKEELMEHVKNLSAHLTQEKLRLAESYKEVAEKIDLPATYIKALLQ